MSSWLYTTNNDVISKPAASNDDEDDFELFGPIQKSPYSRCLELCDRIEKRIQREDILSVPTATCSGQFKTKSTVSNE